MADFELAGLSERSKPLIEDIIDNLGNYRYTVKEAVDEALRVLSDEEFRFPFLENCPKRDLFRNSESNEREEILRLFFQHIINCKYTDEDIEKYNEDYRLGLIKGVKWNCLDSERTCQTCREYVSQNLYGLGPGIYPPDKIPPMPHIGCICFLSAKLPVAEGDEKSIKNPVVDIIPEGARRKNIPSGILLIATVLITLFVIVVLLLMR